MQPVNKFSSTKNIPSVTNPKGAGGPRRPHQKTYDRIHLAVRLELRNMGLSSGEIAKTIGISQTAYSILKKTAHYQNIKAQYMTGVLSQLDDGVSDTYEVGRKYLEVGVPIAFQNLLKMAMDETNKRLQLKASLEILDREGRHAKVSRVGVASPEQNAAATNEDNEMAKALLAATMPRDAVNAVTIDDPPVTQTKQ